MAKKKLLVLVLYGDDADTNPRHELMAWLSRDSLNVKATLVAESPPHSEGAVDDRVMRSLKPTRRSRCLRPMIALRTANVIDEIGRWRGAKGQATICIVRQESVPVYSNHGRIDGGSATWFECSCGAFVGL